MSDELEALRRRAYSRGGTADDLRRLAELESWLTVETVSEPLPESAEKAGPESLPPESVPSDGSSPAPSRPRRVRAVLAAGVVGAVAGAAITAALLWPTPSTAPEPVETDAAAPRVIDSDDPLAVFDREPGPRDLDPGRAVLETFGPSDDPVFRWLGDLEDAAVYAARPSPDPGADVCLIVSRPSSGAAGCTTLADFQLGGIAGTFDGIDVRWGPVGTALWAPLY